MGIYDRFMGLQEPQLAVHHFCSLAAEFARGKVTGTQAGDALGLSAAEKTEANTLLQRVLGGQIAAKEVEDVLLCAEQRIFYTTVAQVKTRLGV